MPPPGADDADAADVTLMMLLPLPFLITLYADYAYCFRHCHIRQMLPLMLSFAMPYIFRHLAVAMPRHLRIRA